MIQSVRTAILMLLVVFGNSTGSKAQHNLQQVSWLAGTWENKTPRGSLYESWIPVNDTLYQGKSYVLHNKDTVVLESIQLIVSGGRLYYIPAVTRQNKGQAVTFTSSAITAGNMVFENPAHDFPQQIAYMRITPDSLVATISGVRNGQKKMQQFPMKKIR